MPKKHKLPPEDFEQECSTVWSFPRRWNWMTHNSKYRWNWSPEVVRNLILRYSKEGDFLLDPMIWGGTTAIEAKLLNRNLLCYDINPDAIELTKKYLDFEIKKWELNKNDIIKLVEMSKDDWKFKYKYWIWLYVFTENQCKIDVYENWKITKQYFFKDWEINNV